MCKVVKMFWDNLSFRLEPQHITNAIVVLSWAETYMFQN